MGQIITIDDVAADNAISKTQKEHIYYFNKRGEIMIDASDAYNGRFSDKGLESFKKEGRPIDLGKSSPTDLSKVSIVVLAGRIFYKPDNLSARIVHHYDSAVIKPFPVDVKIPVLQRKCIKEVVSVKTGLKYQQAYWGTTDGAKRLVKRIEEISGLSAYKIFCWTPDQDSRRHHLERVFGLVYNNGEFNVMGDYLPYSIGCSRRVSIT